ncbi:hypothetical protein HTIA_p3036 (plasmid) [Halorhabdus tiamatea SARL4B]|nr:hypothetical protein HTIA_p3036 [Halorhabdus tiamatea SARL4B]
MLEGCWAEQCTAYRYIDEYRDRDREHELDTLEKLDELANHIRQTKVVEA